LFIQT